MSIHDIKGILDAKARDFEHDLRSMNQLTGPAVARSMIHVDRGMISHEQCPRCRSTRISYAITRDSRGVISHESYACRECCQIWFPDGNFDRCSACGSTEKNVDTIAMYDDDSTYALEWCKTCGRRR